MVGLRIIVKIIVAVESHPFFRKMCSNATMSAHIIGIKIEVEEETR